MAKIPVQFKESKYHSSCQGALPHVQYYSEVFCSLNYLEFFKKKCNLGWCLSSEQVILSNATVSLVREKLHLAIMYIHWGDQNNYDHITYAEVSKHL